MVIILLFNYNIIQETQILKIKIRKNFLISSVAQYVEIVIRGVGFYHKMSISSIIRPSNNHTLIQCYLSKRSKSQASSVAGPRKLL